MRRPHTGFIPLVLIVVVAVVLLGLAYEGTMRRTTPISGIRDIDSQTRYDEILVRNEDIKNNAVWLFMAGNVYEGGDVRYYPEKACSDGRVRVSDEALAGGYSTRTFLSMLFNNYKGYVEEPITQESIDVRCFYEGDTFVVSVHFIAEDGSLVPTCLDTNEDGIQGPGTIADGRSISCVIAE